MRVVKKALPLTTLVLLIVGCASSQRDNTLSAIGQTDTISISGTESTAETPLEISQAATETHELVGIGEAGVGLDLERGEGFTRLVVNTASTEPVYDVQTLSEPPRLVIDLLGEQGSINSSWEVPQDQFVSRVRMGAHDEKVRVVFDLTELGADLDNVQHQIDADTGQVSVTFLDSQATLLANAQALDTPTASFETAALATESSVPETTFSTEISEATEVTTITEELDAEITSPAPELAETEFAETEIAADLPEIDEPQLQTIDYAKNKAAGEIWLGLTDSVGFELRQTAPSEYALELPGVTAGEATRLPVLAPAGKEGIRTARAVQNDDGVTVRMFVDAGTRLVAKPDGNKILITALAPSGTANARTAGAARAQLEEAAEETEEAEPARPPEGGIMAADGSKRYTGRLISLDLQDTDIDNALRIIAEVSNLNIIASDDVQGKVTLRLIDVPWDQALDVILKTNGLDQVKEGNVIRIAPVEKLRAEREALREAKRAAEDLEDLQVGYLRVSYARVTELQEQVETVLSERGSVTVDERTNQLIVKDINKGQQDVQELVSRLDLRTPQVLLETQIVESQRNLLRDLGFQWNFIYRASPETGNATGHVFPNSILAGGSATDLSGTNQMVNFPAAIAADSGSAVSFLLESADGSRTLGARITALENEGLVKVVSRPQVATVNNKPAQIKSVEKLRVRLPDSGLSVATGSGASASGGGSSAFEEIDVGITLNVTPQASPDYYVLLDVEAVSSTLGPTVVDNIPSTIEREATSTILVQSGQTFALGGVYRIEDTDRIEGVPFMKDIPFIGHLFRRSFIDKNDEELIFFITPHIVEGSFDPSLM